MSYINDKNVMNDQMDKSRKRLIFIIKITFIALFISLVALIIAFIVSFAVDDEAPVIRPAASKEVVGYVGEAPAYKQFVIVTDNKDETPELNVNSTAVNTNKEGRYTVYYQAIDEAGNYSYYQLTYVVKNKIYTLDKLEAKVAAIAADLGITKNMDKETQVRKIYAFVHKVVDWSTASALGMSNIPNINRNNWKTDWVEEAIRTLELYEQDACVGDCYSYYSVSKAFFEYFDIENIGIMRHRGSSLEGTHYWSAVNIGENGRDLWYYYDATILAGTFTDGSENACLITKDTLYSYVTRKGGKTDFYLLPTTPDLLDFSSAGGVNSLSVISTQKLS